MKFLAKKTIRHQLKSMLFSLAFLIVSPTIAVVLIEQKLKTGNTIFILFGQFFSLFPGLPGIYIRAAYYYATLADCSWEVHIGFGSHFSSRNAGLGRHVSIGAYCVIGDVLIGEEALIASRVSIPSGKYQHLVRDMPKFELVVIGNNTWIGEGAIILANVGRHCIISAGAVITKAVGDGEVVAGNPARTIRILQITETN